TAISPELTILEIETPDYIISRVGRNWKSEPNIGISSIHLEQIVNNWQTTSLESTSIQDISPSEFIIKFFVAEQQQPIIIQLHQQDNDRFILQVDEKLFLSLPSDKLVQFLGR
ncbi:hypothetical protein N8878_05775, partial [Psychromonas sp.]|nr:hypothetical protein [Psychromonas sp.]